MRPAINSTEQGSDSLKSEIDSFTSSDPTQHPGADRLIDSAEKIESDPPPVMVEESIETKPDNFPVVAQAQAEHVKKELADTIADYYSVDVDSMIYSELIGDTAQSPQPLLESHELITDRTQSNAITTKTPDWMLGILLLIFLLFSWVRVYHSRRLRQLYQALTSKLYVQHILRTNDGLMQRVSFVLDVISYLVLASFLFQVFEYYQLNIPYSNYLHPFLIILLTLIVIYQIKNMILIMSGVLLNQQEKLHEYRFNVFLMNKTLGIVLTPIIICIAYLSFGEAVNIGIGLFLIITAYLYRINRGWAIGLKEANVSVFYLFMYLCTLEFLPLVVLTRLFIDAN